MAEISHSGCRLPLNTVQHLYAGTSGKGSELGFPHFGRCHHLHRLGNLRSTADGAYTPSQVAWAVHKSSVPSSRSPKFKSECRELKETSSPRFLELIDGCFHFGSPRCADSFFLCNFAE